MKFIYEPTAISILSRFHPDRCAVEAFIRRQYHLAYHAEITIEIPWLFATWTDDREVIGAAGIRPAAIGRMFLESYLDRCIERALADATGSWIERSGIVEIGNLASAGAGGTRWLIALVTAFLQGQGFEWAIFTATMSLRNTFDRLGIHKVDLGRAHPSRLETARHNWGTYYEGDPRVVAVRVQDSVDALLNVGSAHRVTFDCSALWNGAVEAGRALSFGKLITEEKADVA